MKVADLAIRRPVSVGMCTLAIVIFGAISFTRLPYNLLPEISYPTLTIETRYPDAAPAEVESLVTRPVEEAVGVLAGLVRLSSRSRAGSSEVTLEFGWKTNMDLATLDLREKLDLVTLPRDAEKPVILRFDPNTDPILRLAVKGGDGLTRTRRYAEDELKKDLESIDGLASVKVRGGLEEEVHVKLDEGKVALFNLTIEQVRDALARNNINAAGGSVYEEDARYLVRTLNQPNNIQDVRDIILADRDGRRLYVGDVAEVTMSHKKRETVSRLGGTESVEMDFYKEGDANTVQVARAVKSRLAGLKKSAPEGYEWTVIQDSSLFIENAIKEVIGNAWQGGLLAIIVLFFFLRQLRPTLIIAAAIPISIMATFIIMYRTGISLNIMSLGGLALGVGMLVDNAIVVLESIFRHNASGKDALASALAGASEVGSAVSASTYTTVVVFLPVIFVEGIAGELFKDQALTISFSLLASLALSLTLIPAIYARLARKAADPEPAAAPITRRGRLVRWLFTTAPAAIIRVVRAAGRGIGKIAGWLLSPVLRLFSRLETRLYDLYPSMLNWALAHRAQTLALSLGLLAISIAMIPLLGVNLIPDMSQGEFQFEIELPEGTALDKTNEVVARMEKRFLEIPGLATISSTVGDARGSSTDRTAQKESYAELSFVMADAGDRAAEAAAIESVRSVILAEGIRTAAFSRPSYFTFRTPVEVEVFSDNLRLAESSAAKILEKMRAIPGLTDVKSSLEAGTPELQVVFDQRRLAELGLTTGQISEALRAKIRGDAATRWTRGEHEIDILVTSADRDKDSLLDIQNLVVAQRGDISIPLRSVATTTLASAPREIRRTAQRRVITIGANLQGRDLGSVARDIDAATASAGIPAGVQVRMAGQREEVKSSFNSLYLAGALAVFLVYFVIAAQFESLLAPLVVMATVPLALIGCVAALVFTATPISVIVLIGFVMLAGIVVNNAIVLIDYVQQLRREGSKLHDALVEAAKVRLRPILMTTLTTVLGLLPMALGLGEGAEVRAPMAITVIGGLALSTLLTLVVVPMLYTFVDRRA